MRTISRWVFISIGWILAIWLVLWVIGSLVDSSIDKRLLWPLAAIFYLAYTQAKTIEKLESRIRRLEDKAVQE